jgi:1-phosphofructokinase
MNDSLHSLPRLITITLNPAIDHTIRLPRLQPGEVHRAEGDQLEAGGKGVGVAAVVAALGRPVSATGWLGEANDAVFVQAFDARHIDDAMVRLPGATRTNIKLAVAERGDSTDINLPGLALTPEALTAAEAALCTRLHAIVKPGDWCELAGARLVIDTGGKVLLELLRRLADPQRGVPVPVAFIKPNQAELEELAGRSLPTASAVAAAAQALCTQMGVKQLIVSLGADGAVMATSQGCWQAAAPAVPVATTVGAGDALVAGTVAALMDGQPLPAAGVFGMACAAARIQRIAPGLPPRAEVDQLAARITAQPLQA